MPIRVYTLKKGEQAVRLTFLAGARARGYWGIEETRTGQDAPVLQQPNFKHVIKGREYDFYYSGPHLHMVVLQTRERELLGRQHAADSLSNETMIEIAKGLSRSPRR